MSTKNDNTANYSSWSPLFISAAGTPFQVRVDLYTGKVDFDKTTVVLTSDNAISINEFVTKLLGKNNY
jgi:hypothetical protein